jgi:hypothetical protein
MLPQAIPHVIFLGEEFFGDRSRKVVNQNAENEMTLEMWGKRMFEIELSVSGGSL